MSKRSATRLAPPFLKEIGLIEERIGAGDEYPFSLPLVKNRALAMRFDRAVALLVGENGTGKSTILEAIADNAGFNLHGGSRDHRFRAGQGERATLARALRLSWLPRVTRGFFFRSETFFGLADHIDEMAASAGPIAYQTYGEKSLHQQSHGEAFFALFANRFTEPGLYLLDEPEVALSPTRIMAFLVLLHGMQQRKDTQVIIATHSPLLMALPGAQILHLRDDRIEEARYTEIEHFRMMRRFFHDPERFMQDLLAEE